MIQRLSEVWQNVERVARDEGVMRIGASGLDDEHRGALSQHEAVSVDVPGPRGSFGFVIAPFAAIRPNDFRGRSRRL